MKEQRGDQSSVERHSSRQDQALLRRTLEDRVAALNEGRTDTLGGPFTSGEGRLLEQVLFEHYEAEVQRRRLERRRLKAHLGRRAFVRLRRRGDQV